MINTTVTKKKKKRKWWAKHKPAVGIVMPATTRRANYTIQVM